MPADARRVSFREDKSRSGSSRSSTLKSDSGAGSSSTGSSYSGTAFPDRYNVDPLYEVNVLRQALADSVSDVDKWKEKAHEVDQKLRKELGEAKSRVQALEDHCAEVEDDKRQLQREKTTLKTEAESLKARVASLQDEKKALKQEIDGLKQDVEELEQKNSTLKKRIEKQPARAPSPEPSKPHRSESKRSKESDSDKEKSRLRERFVPRNENPSEGGSSKRSSSKAPRSRRMSTTTSYADRPYVEPYGYSAPRPAATMPTSPTTSGGRRLEGYVATSKTGLPSISTLQDPVYSSTPRSTGLDRPPVAYQYADAPMSSNMAYEDGNYHAHPLPPRR